MTVKNIKSLLRRDKKLISYDIVDCAGDIEQDAVRGWERTLVNEFLTQMEEFSGILICTTNLKNIMDPAMQRRFHILTEFKPLEKAGIEKLLRSDSVTPGERDTIVFKMLEKEGIVKAEENGIKGWFRAPYDPEIKKGALIILLEEAKYDILFPNNPLSECIRLVCGGK